MDRRAATSGGVMRSFGTSGSLVRFFIRFGFMVVWKESRWFDIELRARAPPTLTGGTWQFQETGGAARKGTESPTGQGLPYRAPVRRWDFFTASMTSPTVANRC